MVYRLGSRRSSPRTRPSSEQRQSATSLGLGGGLAGMTSDEDRVVLVLPQSRPHPGSVAKFEGWEPGATEPHLLLESPFRSCPSFFLRARMTAACV